MIRYTAWALFAIICLSVQAQAAHLHPEKTYQNYWCADQGGVTEYVLPDRSRVDCLTDTHAVEVDFAPKWAEAIGQALFYSLMTGRRPGVLLIIERQPDKKYLKRLNMVAEKYNITIWTIAPANIQ
jgi:hypothetical protein